MRANDHAGNQYHLLAEVVQVLVGFFGIKPFELSNNVCKYHVLEVISHELRIGHQVLELKLQQLGGGLLLVEKVQVLHLLKHFVFDDLAPDGLDEVAPLCGDLP